MKRLLTAAAAALLLAAEPAQAGWEKWRDIWLDTNFGGVFNHCTAGRKLNSKNYSYMPILEETRVGLISDPGSFSKKEINYMMAGMIAAIRRVCPDVW